MAAQIGFRDFVSQLPIAERERLGPKKLPLPEWMVQPLRPNPCFVEPYLIAEIPTEVGKTSVIILSAPGAVGKSTVATEIACACKTICWDLSKIQVGSETFVGWIYKTYETNGHGVLKGIKDGNWLFVLDALDEAQVRAGSTNFEAFLGDLIEIVKEPRSRPVLVLLARNDTATWIELLLEAGGVSYSHYKIGNFDEPQALEFIDKRLDVIRDKKGEARVHRTQVVPYKNAKDKLFKLIYRLLSVPPGEAWSAASVRTFLGYAPVLEALTDYLYHPNYQALINELDAEVDSIRDPWRFLGEVVNRLLIRESGKQRASLQPPLANIAKDVGWDEWASVYGDSEQCRRVLEFSLKQPPGQLELVMPVRLATEYERIIRSSVLPEHPFLAEGRDFANVVFKEYLYAWGLTHGSKGLADVLRRMMRNRQEPFLPSQLFSRFILRSEDGPVPFLEGRDLGVLYDSLLTRADDSDDVSISILENGEATEFLATLDLLGENEVECELLNPQDGISIWHQLKKAEIDISSPIELGLEGQRFVLGPNVDLSCSELTVNCEDLSVDVSGPVHLRAGYYKQGSQDLRLRVLNGEPANLGTSWPDPAYPWGPYGGLKKAASLDLQDDEQGNALRKLLLMFRQQRTRKASTVLKKRWSPEQLVMRTDLVGLAQRMGVLRRDTAGKDDFFEFNNNDYGSLMTLIEGPSKLSEKAWDFLVAYFGVDKAKSLIRP